MFLFLIEAHIIGILIAYDHRTGGMNVQAAYRT